MADVNVNAYQGNANLGYGTAGVGGGLLGAYEFKATLNAWDRFAMYNFTAKRDIWEEANKQQKLLAEEAGRLSVFSYGDMSEKDRAEVLKSVEDFTSYFKENPNAVRLQFGQDGKASNAEAHSELLKRRSYTEGLIKRANQRKAQETALETQVAGIKDPVEYQKARQWMDQQRNKPIMEDLELYPSFELFNHGTFLGQIMPDKVAFDEMRQNPNDVTKTTTAFTNFNQGLSRFNMQYMTNPKVQREFDGILTQWNEIVENSKGADGKVDVNKLRKHPGGSAIMQAFEASNTFFDTHNSAVDKGLLKLDKIEKINLDDGLTPDEMGKLYLSSSISMATEKSFQQTDNAIQQEGLRQGWARIALDREQLNAQIDQFKANNDPSGGEIGNRAWWNLGALAQRAGGTGAGVDVTNPLYQNAFARNTGQKEKITDLEGNVVERPVTQAPEKVVVYPGKDANSFEVLAVYKDEDAPEMVNPQTGKKSKGYRYQKFSADQAYDQMSYVSGDNRQAGALSLMNTKFRMDKIGTRKVDWNQMNQFFKKGEAAAGATPAASGGGSRTTIKLSRTSVPKNLKTGQDYELNGKVYFWNGTNLVPKN